jgi:hypothetical protein
MSVTVDRVAPVAHLPLVLGVLRKLEIATLIDSMIRDLSLERKSSEQFV